MKITHLRTRTREDWTRVEQATRISRRMISGKRIDWNWIVATRDGKGNNHAAGDKPYGIVAE